MKELSRQVILKMISRKENKGTEGVPPFVGSNLLLRYQVPGQQSVETGKQICAHLSLAQKLRTHKKIKGKRKNGYQIPPLVSEIDEPKAFTTEAMQEKERLSKSFFKKKS